MEFNTVWNIHKDHLLSFIKLKVPDSFEATDILQEVSIKLFTAQKNGFKIENYKAWLFKVTRNLIVDYYRKQRVISKDKFYVEADEAAACVCDLSGFVIQNYLSEEYSSPLYMSDIEKKPQKEIAKELKLTLSATKSRIQRARVKLKELIENCVDISYNKTGEIINYRLKSNCKIPEELEQEIKRINLIL